MPILKHAKKKLKQDKKRTIRNKLVKNTFKLAVKKAKTEKNAKTVSGAFKAIDKAVKKNLIHKNKAARMKSSLSKLVSGSGAKSKTAEAKNTKPASVKTKPAAKKVAKPKTAVKKASPKTSKK